MKDNWKTYKIRDIANVINGGTPNTKITEYWNGDIPWLTPRDLTGYKKILISKGERNITKKGLQNSSAKLLPKGTILLTSRAPIGYVAIAENEITTNQGFKNLIVKENLVNNIFFYYWLKNNVEYLKSLGTGTTFGELNKSTIETLEIEIPSISEQKAIAAVLSILDDKIDLLHRQNKTMEALAETLFRQWFIEEAKDDWKEGTLGNIASFHNGKKRPDNTFLGKNPIYGGNGILGYSEKHNYDNTTIIIGRVGAYCGSLYIEHRPVWVSDNASVAKPLKNGQSSFLFFLLRYLSLNEMAEGSSHPLLTQTLLKSIQIQLPPNEIIESFVSQVDTFLNKINFNNSQIRTLEKLRGTLLPKLMSGEVRVKMSEPQMGADELIAQM